MVTATLLHGHMLVEFSRLSKVVLEKFSHSVMGRAVGSAMLLKLQCIA